MNSSLLKKIMPLILSITFSIVGFGVFVGVANASLATDIASRLYLDPSYIPSDLIDIPADLKPDQQATILDNIITNPLVQSAAAQVTSAITKLDAANASCSQPYPIGNCTNDPTQSGKDLVAAVRDATNALSDAKNKLADSLTSAVKLQGDQIKLFRAQNESQSTIDGTFKTLTDNGTAAQGDIVNIGNADVGNQQIDTSRPTQAMTDAAKVQQQNAANYLNSSGDTVAITMQDKCDILGGNWTPCIAGYVFYPIYKISSYLLMGSGFIFDKMLMLSIDNSGGMVTPAFIDSSWTVVRDFSNMIFIFILLYTGIMTMFGQANWREVILKVVFIALVINFSLFFTKVIIDAGNILTVGVLSGIGGDSISAGLASAFQPQKFLAVAGSTGDTTGVSAIIVFVVATIVTSFAAYVFFKAALLFVRRLVVFWALMILSPFAFVSTAIPKANKFQEWFSTLLGLTFVAPVFLFFIYLIMMVIQADGGILSKFGQTGGWFEALIGPVIVATILIKALSEALSFAEHMAGSTGEAFSGLVSGALGLATGGASMVAQKTLGRAALSAAGSDRFKAIASKSAIGRVAYSLTDKAANAGFDVRNIPGVGSNLGIGKGAEGSFAKTVKEAKDADIAFGKKVATGKDGKPIKTTYTTTEKVTNADGTITEKKVEKEGTTTQAFAEQLKKGYYSRVGTGGNIGAEQAAKEVEKTEKKRIKLAEKEAEKIKYLKETLGIKETDDLDSEEAKEAKKRISSDLEEKAAKAEAELKYIETNYPNDTNMLAAAIVSKKQADKAIKKFETAQADIDKIQKELKDLGGDKGSEKKAEKH